MNPNVKGAVFILACLCSSIALASAGSVLFYDTFNRNNNYDIDAFSTGMSGTLSPLSYTEVFEDNGTGSIRVSGSVLQMATNGGMSSMYLNHNFTDDSIISAGGFTVKLDVVQISGGTDVNDCFGGFGIGLSQYEAASAGDWNSATAFRPSTNGSASQGVCDFYIDLALDGYVRAWSGDSLLGSNYVGATSGQLWVDFLTPGFSGQPFIARMYFNGREIAVSRLTWNQSNQNYIGISARAGTYVKLDNLTITPYEDIITDKLDVTGDTYMNMADLNAVADQWLYGYNPPYPSADLNDDFNVNHKDLSVISRHWPYWGSYSNPVINITGTRIADPSVIYYQGVYYLYGTSNDATEGYRVWTSTNLVDWTRGPQVFTSYRQENWAPDVWRDPASGWFYLYYTITSTINTSQKVVGVAEASSPYGPFNNMRDLFEDAIDAHMFRDDDGSLYLYYVQFPGFNISVTRMSNPRTPTGSPTVILNPQSAWEKYSLSVTEGPWIIKRNGIYYMLYSGSHTADANYATGYATATNPMGPFARAIHNPIVMRSENVYGPGHGCAIRDAAGDWWHVHHQKRNADYNTNRYICLDRLWFDQVGNLYGKATRYSYLPVPAE